MAGFPKDIEFLFKKLYKDKKIKAVKPGNTLRLGYPVMFVYDAKWKNQLPYWDALPFSIVIANYNDGFLGINLHYLPWAQRLQLAKKLVRATKNKNRISYVAIKQAWLSLKLPEALLYLCIRRYLSTHVRSTIKVFDWETYDLAVKDIRPRFQKESEKAVLAAIREKFSSEKRRRKAYKN